MTMNLALATDEDREPRRNALILSAAGAVIGSAPIVAFSLGGLAGLYLLGEDKSLATLPISFFVVGGALGAIPAAMLMSRIGRRAGFIVGALCGVLGGLAAGFAVLAASFPRSSPPSRSSASPMHSCSSTASPPPMPAVRSSAPRQSPGCLPAGSLPESSGRRR